MTKIDLFRFSFELQNPPNDTGHPHVIPRALGDTFLYGQVAISNEEIRCSEVVKIANYNNFSREFGV
jgi:hypothetical protein